jgi:hypothetical protein
MSAELYTIYVLYRSAEQYSMDVTNVSDGLYGIYCSIQHWIHSIRLNLKSRLPRMGLVSLYSYLLNI